MFQLNTNRIRAFLSTFDDVLGDPQPQAAHPHRRPLKWDRQRRPGMVASRPAHCLCPVRSERIAAVLEQTAR
jgi:hypothetical protein